MAKDRPVLTATHAIVNANSGREEGVSIRDTLADCVGAAGGTLTMHEVRRGDDLPGVARRALDAGATTVVAAGGDGTLCGVAQTMAGSGVAMGVIPLGTFNYFARAVGIPEDSAAAIRAICNGRLVSTPVGRINDRVFLNNTSIGVYSAILKQREDTYRRFGRSRLAAYWSVVRALIRFYDPMTMKIDVDGERISVKSPLAFVGNSSFQLERFGLAGADAVRSGKLALYLADDVGRMGLVKHAARLAVGAMQEGRDFRLVTGTEIEIDPGKHKRLVVRDGEKEPMRGPYRIRLVPGALDLVVPEEEDREALA
ncbi:diacylglycerol kinase family protein [Maritimibacter sp. DP1N21-5]|uniref:diacylglycerol/lipid kinase family protein n=1 Tax=Maritimibacter sp. DP1N21-5 TaxID=2836867 RepID=UPI001C45720F|nr:diacylglycerol kinase family protein [Maritimibacter sp. DP1N21-5]MBV7407992.1 NAD(+)/NADH kinase [Maritimibacter sp. DP1N21-5]